MNSYLIRAKYVIQTVGPVWRGGNRNEAELLASCYRRRLEVAAQHGIKTIAFSNISTGVYGYPKELAAPMAIKTVQTFLEENPLPEKVFFCIFGKDNLKIYKGLIGE